MTGPEPFEQTVRELHRYVFHGGIDALKQHGIIHRDEELLTKLEESPSVMRRFIRGCHYGFDLAQRQIGSLVIDREVQIRALTRQLKQQRRDRNKQGEVMTIAAINFVGYEQIVLRRLVDAILHHVVAKERWILRRTQLNDAIHPIDPQVLRETLDIAVERNREDRTAFHVVSDLTTAVQIGDLVRISFSSDARRWEVIELKSGKVNETLGEIVRANPESTQELEATLGETTSKQLQRMLRQARRQAEIERFRLTDRGVDPKLGVPMRFSAEPVEVDDYGEAVRKVCGEATENRLGVASIDGCFKLVAIRDDLYRMQGHGGVAHLFYHLQRGGGECKLPDELEEMETIWPFFDLGQMNLFAMWPPPVYMWPMPHEMVFDILFRRVRVYGQLDYDRLFELGRDRGLEMTWKRDVPSTRMGFQSLPIRGSSGARGVHAKLIGADSVREQILLNGMFARVFLEMMPPRQLIEVVLAGFRDEAFGQTAPSAASETGDQG
jgi:hypothetical protein